MTTDGASRLSRLTRLSLQGRYVDILNAVSGQVETLGEEESFIAANAAAQSRNLQMLRNTLARLQKLVGNDADVIELRFRLALLADDLDEARRAIDLLAPPSEVARSQVTAQLSKRLVARHAWDTLAELLARCRGTDGELPRPLYIANSALNLRRRAFADAVLAAEKALDTAPQQRRMALLVLVARVSEAAGEDATAAEHYRQALQGERAPPRILYRAAQAMVRTGRWRLAQRMAARARQSGAAGPGLDYVDGMVALFEDRVEDAYELFDSLRTRWPQDVRYVRAWFSAYERTTTSQPALDEVERLLGQFDDGELHAHRVGLLRALGRAEEAERHLSQARARHPDNQALRVLAGLEPAAPARPAESEEEAQEAVQDEDQAQNQEEAGDEAEAEAGRQAVRSGPLGPGDAAVARAGAQSDIANLPAEFRPRWTGADLRRDESTTLGLRVQARVVRALILRELRTRFGRLKLGYVWAFVEPALHTATLYLVWSVRGKESLDGLPLILFLITGFVPFFTFSNTYGQVNTSLTANHALLSHRPVKPLDCVIARAILEFLTKLAVFLCFLLALMLANFEIHLYDPLPMALAMICLWVGGISLGLIVQSLTPVFRSLPVLMGAVMRVLYFTSGVIFPLSMLPRSIQELMLYNPLVHLIEYVRFSFTPYEVTQGVNFGYPLLWVVPALLLGLLMLRAMQARILSA